jgi:hypothetical protein
VLPEGKAIRYGAIVGCIGLVRPGHGRPQEKFGRPTEGEKRRLGPVPNYVEGGGSGDRHNLQPL